MIRHSLMSLYVPVLLANSVPALAAPVSPSVVASEEELPLDARFSPERMEADVAFLADDLLEGRETGTRGHEIAARFVAERFAALGLKPMGDATATGRSYLQRITLQRTERLDAPSGVELVGPKGSASFAHGVDSLVSSSANEPVLDVTAPLMFVGYGIESARFGLADYAGLDVKGKIAVMLAGYPVGLPSEEGAYFSRSKSRTAMAHGAIGIITIDTLLSAKTRPWERKLRNSSGVSFSWIDPERGQAHEDAPAIRANASLDDKAAELLFAGAPRTFASIRKLAAKAGGVPRGFALQGSARIFGQSRSSRVTSPNVVAVLPGSDPALRDKYIVLSGHLDHLGISKPRPGEAADKDRINNGALDNAAGTATTLEVARVLASDRQPPRRSVVFLVSTGEEKGLLGAGYFSVHPTVPADRIVGNVDLDMPLLLYPFTDVIAFGAEHSTIGRQVAQAVAPMKIRLAPDPMPQENIFVRSDHFRFVQQGVPAVFFATGYANGGEEKWKAFLDKVYHGPQDDMSQKIDWRAGARFAEANYRLARAMADEDAPPRWYKGDFFGNLFAPQAVKAEPGKQVPQFDPGRTAAIP